MDEWSRQRQAMVADQIRPRKINDERVLAAFARVPRHLFVPPAQRAQAYADRALPIAGGQTISQPYIVALMTAALRLGGGERVLEVGTGSGYAAAILAELAGSVISVERHPELAAAAAELLRSLGYANVTVVVGDGSAGWPAGAPYDAISVPAGAPALPRALLHQLSGAGRLVIPIGPSDEQHLILIRRQNDGFIDHDLGMVRFVPLIGAGGWSEDAAFDQA